MYWISVSYWHYAITRFELLGLSTNGVDPYVALWERLNVNRLPRKFSYSPQNFNQFTHPWSLLVTMNKSLEIAVISPAQNALHSNLAATTYLMVDEIYRSGILYDKITPQLLVDFNHAAIQTLYDYGIRISDDSAVYNYLKSVIEVEASRHTSI